MFGSYYVYDAARPINDYIKKSMSNSNSQYGLLYTLAIWHSSQGFLLTDFLVLRRKCRKMGLRFCSNPTNMRTIF